MNCARLIKAVALFISIQILKMSINTIAALLVPPLPDVMLEPLVRMALLEDLGRAGDLTTDTIVPADAQDSLRLVARQEGVLAGLDLARLAFRLMDSELRFEPMCGDGTVLEKTFDVARTARRAWDGSKSR